MTSISFRRPSVRRKTANDYHDLAQDRGFCWLGPEVPNAHVKTEWECPLGHHWMSNYNNIQKGTGCPACATARTADQLRKKPEDYRSLAERRGFHWLGPPMRRVTEKTNWQCEQGHHWEACYSKIQQGRGCPICANERRARKQRHHPSDYHDLARTQGITWLGPSVDNSRMRTEWKCPHDHRWFACYSDIQQGKGCPICAGNAPKTPSDYRVLAKSRGFQWLGSEPSNVDTPTTWRCSHGHEWEATYAHVRQGTGCPTCLGMVNDAYASPLQRQLCDMVDGELNYPEDNRRIDVALPQWRVAIEYDAWYWHGYKLEEDALRDQELLDAGWKILHVRSNARLPTRPELWAAISRLQLGKEQVLEIVLDDWGKGPTIDDI